MRATVIGADSPLGRAVVHALRAPPVRLEIARAQEPAIVRAAVADADVVYNCLPLNLTRPLDLFFAVVVLVDACAKKPSRVVHAGSPWAVARGGHRPPGRVGRELFQVEYLLRTAYEAWRLPYTVVRMPDVIGPDVETPPFGPVWRAAAAGRAAQTLVPADVPREMIHVDDAARALTAVGASAFRRREIAANGGIVCTARGLAAHVARAHGHAPHAVRAFTWPERAVRAAFDRSVRAFLPMRAQYAAAAARLDGAPIAELGYAPQVVWNEGESAE